jgi:hypothetical protein
MELEKENEKLNEKKNIDQDDNILKIETDDDNLPPIELKR